MPPDNHWDVMTRQPFADDTHMPSINAMSSISQAQVQSEVSYAVARKSLDAAKAQGDAVIALLQSAADIQSNAQQQTHRPLGPGQTISVVA